MSSTNNDNINHDDVRQQKKALRKEIRAKVKATTDIPEQSQKVWDRLIEMEVYKESKTIGLFLSMPTNEIQTDPILEHALSSSTPKKQIYVPQVGKNFEQADMELMKCPSEVGFYKQWPKNKWQIPEPPETLEKEMAQPGDLDLLIVPGLAFDANGSRLGQGKGYYDRFLARMRKDHSKPTLVAVCMEPQYLGTAQTIPTHEHDYTMEYIVTPNEIIRVPAATTEGEPPTKKLKTEQKDTEKPLLPEEEEQGGEKEQVMNEEKKK